MALVFLESGSDATQALEFFTHTVGAVASSTLQAHTGPRSVIHASFAGSETAYLGRHGDLADAGRRLSAAFRFDSSLPAADTYLFMALTSGFAGVFGLELRTDGKLQVNDAAASSSVVGSAVLAADTWYQIAISFVITSTTNFTIKVWVNGTLDITATNANFSLVNTGAYGAWWGIITNPGGDWIIYTDDFYIDDGSGLDFPGLVRVTYKAPGTVNNNNFDTAIGTSAVNERPISAANGRRQAGSGSADQDYNLQSRSAGDVDITGKTIAGYGAWVWALEGAAGTGTGEAIIHNGSAQGISLTTAASLFVHYVATTTYPTAAAAIGMRSTGGTRDCDLYECGMLVAYTPEADLSVTPGVAALTTATFASKLTLAVTPTTAALTLTTFAPQLRELLTPATAALTTATFAPTITVGGAVTVTPGTAALTTATFAPQLQETLTPATAALNTTAFAPQLQEVLTPGTLALTTSTFAPQLQETLTPGTAALVLTTYAPTVTVAGDVSVTPGTAALVLQTFAPLIIIVVPPTPTPSIPTTVIGAARYQIVIKDHSGTRVALLTEWVRLEYVRRVNAPDSHVLQIDGGSAVAALLLPESALDYQLEVWRRDGLRPDVPASSPLSGQPWVLDYEGFHRTAVDEVTPAGRRIFTSYGRGYDDLLDRRAILYPAGSAGAAKSGVGETVIKAYVEENAGPSATAPPRLYGGVTAGLSIEPSSGAGGTWEGARFYRNLLEVVQEIAAMALVDFRVVGTGPALFEFRAKAYPWGDDRSVAGLDTSTGLNGAGNAPVIFSLAFGNMASAVYSRNRTNEANAVIMLGQGLEAARAVVQREDAMAQAASPWNRREVTRNANQESETAGLEAAGDILLHDLRARESFNFTVLQSAPVRYSRDYRLGDLVTARYKTFQRDYQITGVTVTVEAGRETIVLEVRQDD